MADATVYTHSRWPTPLYTHVVDVIYVCYSKVYNNTRKLTNMTDIDICFRSTNLNIYRTISLLLVFYLHANVIGLARFDLN